MSSGAPQSRYCPSALLSEFGDLSLHPRPSKIRRRNAISGADDDPAMAFLSDELRQRLVELNRRALDQSSLQADFSTMSLRARKVPKKPKSEDDDDDDGEVFLPTSERPLATVHRRRRPSSGNGKELASISLHRDLRGRMGPRPLLPESVTRTHLSEQALVLYRPPNSLVEEIVAKTKADKETIST